MLITTCGAGFRGAIGQIVSVQLHHTRGARFHVSGMNWNHARHILARIYAALEVIDLPRPSGAFTLHIGPAHVKPASNELDVPISLCLLSVAGLIDSKKLARLFSLGELALDGSLIASNSLQSYDNLTLSSMKILKNSGAQVNRCIVPNQGEALSRRFFPSTMPTYQANHLKEALEFLQNNQQLQRLSNRPNHIRSLPLWTTPLFDSISGQAENKEALVIAAAGGHHTFIMGPPGSGKTLMARSLAELVPNVSPDDREHLQLMHAKRKEVFPEDERIPFRQPHVQSSPAALAGSWTGLGAIPGELALSHKGVFCLDEFPEFARNTLETLRAPLETGFIELNRAQGSCVFPAQTLAVATANPCPCGYLTMRNGRCKCTPGVVRKYLNRMTGPLMDRFAIHIETQFEEAAECIEESSAFRGEKAIQAIQWVRNQKSSNSTTLEWSTEMKLKLEGWSNRNGLSRRGFKSAQTVAETACLLDAWQNRRTKKSQKISEQHVVIATRLRIFDQTDWLSRAFATSWPHYPSSE